MKKSTVVRNLYILSLIGIFCLGIFLRTKVFLMDQSFWHDECALAWNILNKDYNEFFNPLRFLQVAPPLFLVLTKFLTENFGYSENIFRLIPFVTSLFSIWVFYLLTLELFYTKRAVLISNFLFSISFPLLYYTSEFKPYSSDVLFCVLTLFILYNINSKNIVLKSLILSTFIWFSFPTMFFLSAWVLGLIFDKKFEISKKILAIIPFFISSILFYIFYFKKIFGAGITGMTNYWENSFLNWNNYIQLFKSAMEFFVTPSIIIPFLMVLGIMLFFKEKDKIVKIALGGVFILVLMSILKLYPFSGRLIIFLVPLIIIFWTKPLDTKNWIIVVLLLFTVFPQIQRSYGIFIKKEFYKSNANPREMMQYLKANIEQNDIVFVNQNSNADYLYYKKVFDVKNEYIINDYLSIKPKEKVWFFIPEIDEKTQNYIKNEFVILYENASRQSILASGVKK